VGANQLTVKDRSMKCTVAVLAMLAVLSAAPVMASVADSAGSNSGYQAHHTRHHHKRPHKVADSHTQADSVASLAIE
jgi:hypothetical protein